MYLVEGVSYAERSRPFCRWRRISCSRMACNARSMTDTIEIFRGFCPSVVFLFFFLFFFFVFFLFSLYIFSSSLARQWPVSSLLFLPFGTLRWRSLPSFPNCLVIFFIFCSIYTRVGCIFCLRSFRILRSVLCFRHKILIH